MKVVKNDKRGLSKEKLSRAERSALNECEDTIKTHGESFFKVGFALHIIREERLYRSEFPTFDQYLSDRWGFTRVYASNMITSAEAGKKLLTIVNSSKGVIEVTPMRETQVRAIKRLPEPQRQKAWAEGVRRSGNTQPSENVLREVANEISPRPSLSQRQSTVPSLNINKALKALRLISQPSKNITAAIEILTTEIESGGSKSVTTKNSHE